VVIVGPTASGKTDLAIEIAKELGTEIVSADSRQVYKGMKIGTAAPTDEQLAAVPHHLVAIKELTDNYTAGLYEKDALEAIAKIHEKNDYAVLVGGSGMYVDIVCDGMDDIPATPPHIREELTEQMNQQGLESLVAKLEELDPEYSQKVDRENPNRVMRALEVCLATGRPYSEQRKGVTAERPFNIIKIGTDMPRDVLYDRINRRVDMMVADGLEAEARTMYPKRHLNALQTVGYRELFEYFDGNCTFEVAVELVKRNSRRYAKRQLTWFRRDPQTAWFAPSDLDAILRYIAEHVK
jgi:tRNA dimethylallyltransferase